MNKKQFLKQLDEHLIGIKKEDRKEILQDYKEHFTQGKKDKRKESEIAKSLGDPKEIAREIRRELSESLSVEIKSEAVETWVALKRLGISMYDELRLGFGNVFSKKGGAGMSPFFVALLAVIAALLFINSPILVLVVVAAGIYMLYEQRSDRKKTTKRPRTMRLVASLVFNIFFFVWFWVSMLATVLGLLVASFAMMIGGLLVVIIAGFYLVNYGLVLSANLWWAALFAGAGVAVLGWLFSNVMSWLTKLFFVFTKAYIRFNQELIRK